MSVTVKVTLQCPFEPYAREGVLPVPVLKSPKSQAYEKTVPSISFELEPSKLTFNKFVDQVKLAVGGTFDFTTLTVVFVVALAPLLSVTVRVIVYWPDWV